MCNKTSLNIFSGNPFVYNLYIENTKKRIKPLIHKLYVDRDPTFCIKYDDIISKFYNECGTDELNIECIDADKSVSGHSDFMYSGNYIYNFANKSETDSLFIMHDDCYILNGSLLGSHIEYINNKKYDFIFSTLSMGCSECHDIIRFLYPKVLKCHENKTSRFMQYSDVLFGTAHNYFLSRKEILSNPSLKFGYKLFKKGDILPAEIRSKIYTIKNDAVFMEPYTYMLFQSYKKGYQSVYPFISEDFITLYSLDLIDNFCNFEEAGLIHFSGGNFSNRLLNRTTSFSKIFGETTSFSFLERLLTMCIFPILCFDFKKYPYMKDFCFDYYIPEINVGLSELCDVYNIPVKINKNYIIKLGSNFGIPMYKENLNYE